VRARERNRGYDRREGDERPYRALKGQNQRGYLNI